MGRRLALLIATYHYEDNGLRRLTAPAHDAEALASVLRSPEIAGFEVTTLLNEPHYRVGEAIAELYHDRRRDDLTLLYFTGHGLKDDEGRLYLAMTNSQRDNLLFSAIGAEQIDRAMEGSNSRQKILILDCCYSGAYPQGWLAKADSSVHSLERFRGRGRTVLTASDSTQYSFEGDTVHGSGARSVFTKYLVEGIRDGSADLDGDGDITMDELYAYVHDRVVEEMPQQRPKKQDNVEGRTVIARNINWELPAYLRNAIASPIATDRLGALDGLDRLYRIGNDLVRERVAAEFRRLAGDDSKQVSTAAEQRINPPVPRVVEPVEVAPAPVEPVVEAEEPVPPSRPRRKPSLAWAPRWLRRPRNAAVVLAVIVLGVAAAIVIPIVTRPANTDTFDDMARSIGGSMQGTVITPDGRRAYLRTLGSNSVTVVDVATGSAIKTIRIGDAPSSVALAPDGRRLYVTTFEGDVRVVDTGTDTVVGRIPVNKAIGIALTPDEKRAYIISDTKVSVVDVAANKVGPTIGHEGLTYGGIAVSPDGTKVYFTTWSGVSVIDTRTNSIAGNIDTHSNLPGNAARGIAFTPDGHRAVVANSLGTADEKTGFASIIDVDKSAVVAPITLGTRPLWVAVTPDGQQAVVLQTDPVQLSFIHLATNKVSKVVRLYGDGPESLAISPDGRSAFVNFAVGKKFTVVDIR